MPCSAWEPICAFVPSQFQARFRAHSMVGCAFATSHHLPSVEPARDISSRPALILRSFGRMFLWSRTSRRHGRHVSSGLARRDARPSPWVQVWTLATAPTSTSSTPGDIVCPPCPPCPPYPPTRDQLGMILDTRVSRGVHTRGRSYASTRRCGCAMVCFFPWQEVDQPAILAQ